MKNNMTFTLTNRGKTSGKELYDAVLEYGDIVFGFQSGKYKFLDFGLTYN